MSGYSFLFEGAEGCTDQLIARGAIYIVSYDVPSIPGFGMVRGYVQFLKPSTPEKLERKYDGIEFILSENRPEVFGCMLFEFKCTTYGVPRFNFGLAGIQQRLKAKLETGVDALKEEAHSAVEQAFFKGVQFGMRQVQKKK